MLCAPRFIVFLYPSLVLLLEGCKILSLYDKSNNKQTHNLVCQLEKAIQHPSVPRTRKHRLSLQYPNFEAASHHPNFKFYYVIALISDSDEITSNKINQQLS